MFKNTPPPPPKKKNTKTIKTWSQYWRLLRENKYTWGRTSNLPYLGKVNQSKYLYISTRNSKPHPRVSHRSDKGYGPLEITGGRVKNVWCMNFFKKPACLQEFFSRAYDLLFLGITACRIFFRQVSLAGIFFGGIVTPPPVIYFQWSFPYKKIHRLWPWRFNNHWSDQDISLRYLGTHIICIWSAISVYTTVYSC